MIQIWVVIDAAVLAICTGMMRDRKASIFKLNNGINSEQESERTCKFERILKLKRHVTVTMTWSMQLILDACSVTKAPVLMLLFIKQRTPAFNDVTLKWENTWILKR